MTATGACLSRETRGELYCLLVCLFFQNYADLMESVLLRENKFKTEKECDNLMKMLRSLWLEPLLKDLQDPVNTDFMMLESRLRSAYIKLDSDFREEAPGPKSLCYNLAYVYDLVGYANLFLASEKQRLAITLRTHAHSRG